MADTWDASLETGHPLIDRQHRELIALVDQLVVAESRSRDDVIDALDHVVDFTLFHFVAEEDLMVEVDYPPAPTRAMVEQHDEFKAYARLRVIEFRRGETQSIVPLQSFLNDWLKIHEFGLDRQLAEWIRREAGARSENAGRAR